LASYYNVKLESIIKTNKITDPDNLRPGQKLTIPNLRTIEDKYSTKRHVVIRGETIESISILYGIDKQAIIRLNNLQEENIIFEDQSLVIPEHEIIVKKKKQKSHIMLEGETLYQISKKYNIPLNHIIKVNGIKDPNNLKPGLTLLFEKNSIKKPMKMISNGKNADWRKYGVLTVNWSTWNKNEDNSIALALNDKGKPLYIAVNCYSSKLNWKKIDEKWNQWFAPTKNFEFELLDDLCENTREV